MYLSITAVLVYTDLSDKHNTAASSSSDDDEESELSSAMLSKSTSPYLAFTVQQNHMHLLKILSDISRTTRLSSVCDCVHRRRNRVGRVGQVLHGFWGV